MPTNVSVLLMGNGRSVFKNSIHLPCNSNFNKEDARNKVSQVINDVETIEQMRKLFILLTYHFELTTSKFLIPEKVAEYAQNIFVTRR